ncbi:MAG: hypothetical protein Q7J38_06605 [Gallionella sp.]|nr:hypothetical protein [Gallionella sp.]
METPHSGAIDVFWPDVVSFRFLINSAISQGAFRAPFHSYYGCAQKPIAASWRDSGGGMKKTGMEYKQLSAKERAAIMHRRGSSQNIICNRILCGLQVCADSFSMKYSG